MIPKHTCNNPRHKKEAMLSRAVTALLVIVALNTFTCAFILFTIFMGRSGL